jgi:hypothetical protein
MDVFFPCKKQLIREAPFGEADIVKAHGCVSAPSYHPKKDS